MCANTEMLANLSVSSTLFSRMRRTNKPDDKAIVKATSTGEITGFTLSPTCNLHIRTDKVKDDKKENSSNSCLSLLKLVHLDLPIHAHVK